ncbi:Hypothetical protein D9617_4g001170 [Elsinoe fawcettii]|nr:Hypothetical protein D9617_4g001170 [Elsinoe fawcettii]
MQGFNMGRYYPPDSSNPPTFNTSHPLGSRARKLRSEGVLTVRFEMPFAIWCSHCPKPTIIGQGVRFNAEKKKVGNYYSTPIWSFRIKHVICGGAIEIRTDPKAGEYIVTEGAKRRDYGEEKLEEGVLDEEERVRRREDAMAGLEGKKEEEGIKLEAGKRVQELLEDREKWWSDPYEANRMVRKGFRRERKERVREKEKSESIKDRLGLDVELAPETQEDRLRAGMVDFGQTRAEGAVLVVSKPLFERDPAKKGVSRSTPKEPSMKAAKVQAQRKAQLENGIRSSTRLATDPWAVATPSRVTKGNSLMKHVKRTNDKAGDEVEGLQQGRHDASGPAIGLVDYDSD